MWEYLNFYHIRILSVVLQQLIGIVLFETLAHFEQIQNEDGASSSELSSQEQ